MTKPVPDESNEHQPAIAAASISDTQWRELTWALARTQIATAWRISDRRHGGQATSWDRQWYNLVESNYTHIQWLELHVPPGARDDLRQLLDRIGVPFSEAGNFFVPHP